MSEKQKLGQEPAFPCNVHYTEEGRSGTSNPDGSYGEIGMSKRFYAAQGYSDCAYKWAEEMSIDTCMEVLGLPKETKWDYTNHFPKLIVKLQYILSDELLKQENE